MQHFSKYFVQILVIRSKCQGGKDGPEGGGGEKILGESCPLLPAPMGALNRIEE